MKRFTNLFFIIPFCFLLTAEVSAQGLPGNEWIKLQNTYKKVKISENGIYRITAARLDSLGFSNIAGNQFAIFRDGKEIPIYTSTNGIFGGNDYIEFYGSPANGAVNKDLYPQPGYQPDTLSNLFTDSAAYFLTHDNTPHKRLTFLNNSIPATPPTPAPYCWATLYPRQSKRQSLSQGKSHDNSSYFYSADFDVGEGYCYNNWRSSSSYLTFLADNLYSNVSPASTLSFIFGSNSYQSPNNQQITVTSNNIALFDSTFSTNNIIRKTLALTTMQNGYNKIFFDGQNPIAVYNCEIRFPRTFRFSGSFSNQADFELPQSQRYLEIQQFQSGSTSPLLFDLSNQKIYSGTIQGSLLKFYLDADPGEKKMFLTNTTSVTNLSNFQNVTFRDYSLASNEGNYIILTHKDYINSSPNYIQQYKNYRSSPQGGSYEPVVIDVTELYDHFGYGYDYDPLSIKRFIKFAETNWQTKPEYLFIVGKGITYGNYFSYNNNRQTYPYPIVPTWGIPGSDNLFSSFNNSQKPSLATGRISVYNNQEIGDYLEKAKAYEAALKTTLPPTVSSEFWKKSALHIAGGSDQNLQTFLLSTLNNAGTIYEDTLIGGKVKTISKSSTSPVVNVNNPTVDSLINSGINVLTFFGHAAASGFDYNLDNPDMYNSNPRFPLFIALGCDVGEIFSLTNQKTISENYIHSENGGSIVMIAGDNIGYTNTLSQYMPELYKSFCQRNYGLSFGKQYQLNIDNLQDINTSAFMDIHTQTILYQGDPAIHAYNPPKPDYDVEEEYMSSSPPNISTTTDSFNLKVPLFNLGKAVTDTVTVVIEHTHPGNNTATFSDTQKVVRLFHSDTLLIRIPVNPLKDIGINNYTVRIDPDNKIDEISKQNNQATLQLYIYSNKLMPVYPPQFAIVHQQGISLKASTLDAFAPLRKYKIELDTTARFNSPLLQQTEITSKGGVLTWKPNMVFEDSTVYYWRTGLDSVINDSLKWTQSSFVYLAHGSDGWNQSHFFQYLNDNMVRLDLPSDTRKFTFTPVTNTLLMENKIIYPGINDLSNVRNTLNDILLDNWGCLFDGSIHIMVIDKNTGMPWANTDQGLYGSAAICSSDHSRFMFEFGTNTLAGRDSAIKMIERVPSGDYIMVSNMIRGGSLWDINGTTINDWMADTTQLGSGNSLYNAINNLGFTDINQFTSSKPFIFFRKKGDNNYPIYQSVGPDSLQKITLKVHYLSFPDSGALESTVIGPVREWQQLLWKNNATLPNPQNDHTFLRIFGINNQGVETNLYSGNAKDTSLSFINAQTYPKIRLVWNSIDSSNRTSADLDYWRVLYKPVPEAALNAAAHLIFTDSLSQGQKEKLEVAIENISPFPMDSMLVRYKIIDQNNVAHLLAEKRYKKLAGNDSLIAHIDFDADQYSGKNLLYIEANPDNDQPEQYHPNNIGFLPFFLANDHENPLLDVTFDGVHILDKDIVSAKPLIKVLLRDNNQFALLNDSSLVSIQLMKPGESTPENIPFDGNVCRFVSADNSKNNVARVEYRPTLPKDGIYKLIVSGKDKAGNLAENTGKYEVQFTVVNKSTITNVLNYPNPFSTSTQFLFTITGSDIPSQFKIQILTPTGKVVREITKDELGPLHIGRNTTQYRWDGRDQYGQLLGNGVYLYRVITAIQGESIDHRSNVSVDKYFKNGYGKLYIMR